MKYSKSTGGFYDPTLYAADLIDASIPGDAIDLSDEDYQALMDGQAQGKRIVPDDNGAPTLADPPALSNDDAIKAQILDLEGTVTQRRLREAILGTDGGWLAGINQQIAQLSAQLS